MPDGGRFQFAGQAAQVRGAAILFLVVVIGGGVFGIWARPFEFLDSIRPANALALAVLLRMPAAARPAGWGVAGLAFVLSGLAMGDGPGAAALSGLANLIGIGAGYALLARLPEDVIRLRQPAAMLWIIAAAALGGAATGLVGGLAAGGGFVGDISVRWGIEAANYVAILPVLLSAPALAGVGARLQARPGIRKTDLLPAGALALSFALALGVEEPGAIALPVLALVWCGLVFPVFPTALVALGYSLLALAALSRGALAALPGGAEGGLLLSVRLGAAAVAVAPIMLSVLTHHRNRLMARLNLQAGQDPLTGVLNRAAFREDAALLLRILKVPEGWPSAASVLVIDLDHFRAVNDAHGHAAGDAVLREVARRISASLRQRDLVGRLQGEEFAVVLRDCAPEAAVEVAERIRRAIAGEPIWVSTERAVAVSASIGVAPVAAGRHPALDHLLNRAARALYLAKEKGRNQVVATGIPEGRAGEAAGLGAATTEIG